MTSATLATRRLSALEAGETGRVVAIHDEDLVALADVGLREGCHVTVERRLPAGGPVLVELGAARIALARVVAGRTMVVAVARGAAEVPGHSDAHAPCEGAIPAVRETP